jgi:hypothetical protein
MADDISIPLPSEALVNPDSTITPSWYRIFAALFSAFNAAQKAIADQPSFYAWTFKTPVDETVVLIQNSPIAFTVTESTTITEVGTSTVTIKRNGVAIGGTANSASVAQDVRAHATGNVFAVGDDLSVTFSATAGACENLNLTLAITIPLT